MINLKVLGLILILTYCFCSCSKKRNSYEVTNKDSLGNIISIIQYSEDSLQNGIAKFYYKNPKGVLKEEIEYKNGKKNGFHKFFEPEGRLICQAEYKDNLLDGEDICFYKNGKIEEKSFWVKGKQFGLSIWLSEDGRINTLNFIDFYGSPFYIIQDNEFDKTKSCLEMVFSHRFMYNDNLNHSRYDVLTDAPTVIKIAVAELPHKKTIIKMGEENKPLRKLDIENYTATFKHHFQEPGMYKLITVGEIYNPDGTLYKKDSLKTVVIAFDAQ